MQCTTFTTNLPKITIPMMMSDSTFDKLVADLVREINDHPHHDELLSLIIEQLIDDECV